MVYIVSHIVCPELEFNGILLNVTLFSLICDLFVLDL